MRFGDLNVKLQAAIVGVTTSAVICALAWWLWPRDDTANQPASWQERAQAAIVAVTSNTEVGWQRSTSPILNTQCAWPSSCDEGSGGVVQAGLSQEEDPEVVAATVRTFLEAEGFTLRCISDGIGPIVYEADGYLPMEVTLGEESLHVSVFSDLADYGGYRVDDAEAPCFSATD